MQGHARCHRVRGLEDHHAEAGARHQRRAKDMGDELRLRR